MQTISKLICAAVVGWCFFLSIGASAIKIDEPRKVDEYADICCEDEQARLDSFAIELQNNPDATGYVIFYGGRRYPSCWTDYPRHRPRIPYKGEAEARAASIKPYLTDTRGMDRERIVVVNGGHRESWMAELWIVPKGAKFPAPTPTLRPEQIRYRKGKQRSRAFRERCDEG
jgi:hypothetical protein